MFGKAIILALAATPFTTALPSKQDPVAYTLDQLVSSGTGCPGQSVGVQGDYATDKILVFPANQLEATFAGSQTNRRKQCTVMAQLRYPGNTQFTVQPSDWTGYAKLGADVSGVVNQQVYFQSHAEDTASYSQKISGPSFEQGSVFTITSDALNPGNLWSKCGSDDAVSIKYALSISGDSTEAGDLKEFSNSTTGPHHSLQLVWRKC